jgi:HK97 family phage portal protein
MFENIRRLLGLTRTKGNSSSLRGNQWTGTSYIDSWRRTREPGPNELVAELKGIAWTCISLNAAACATFPPSLYVITRHNQAAPKCGTRPLLKKAAERLRDSPEFCHYTKSARMIEEVTNHPALDLLRRPNPFLNNFDLFELTQVYLEVTGRAFWAMDMGPLGTPDTIWVLPSQNVTPKRNPDSDNIVDYFEYRSGKTIRRFSPDQIVFFRFPDPRNPYTDGLSPLRASFEQVVLASEFSATKAAVYENRGIPSALVSPDEVIGEEERDRLQAQWQQRFRRGGSGKVVVAEQGMKVQLLQQSMGDLAALADMKATKEDIANAFHVPIAFFTTNTNLANLQASQTQHLTQAISPRLTRRDEKLNQDFLPLFDAEGRLFFASEDPIPADQAATIQQQDIDMKYGILSVNEVRSARGLPPVPWGHVPWLPVRWAPTDQPRTGDVTGESNDNSDTGAEDGVTTS